MRCDPLRLAPLKAGRLRLEPRPRERDRGVEFLLEELAVGEAGEVFGDVDAGGAELEELDLLGVFAGAKNEAERRLFAGLLLVFGQPTEVKFHLAFELGFEVADLEVNRNEATQAAVEEEEVEIEVVFADLKAVLAGLEGEAVAELEEESAPIRAGWRPPGPSPDSDPSARGSRGCRDRERRGRE